MAYIAVFCTQAEFQHQLDLWQTISAAALGAGLMMIISSIWLACMNHKLAIANTSLYEQSIRDPMTGLYSRQFLEEAIAHIRGRDSRPYCLLFIDLNNFKGINDTYGHPAGDALIQAIAQRIQSAIRITDIAARIGGDEFGVLCTNTDIIQAGRLCDRLISEIEKPVDWGNKELRCQVAIGLAQGNKSTSSDELLRYADRAMYAAKEEGKAQKRSKWRSHSAEDTLQAKAKIQLQQDIEAAIARNEFELYLQPIIPLGSNTVAGYETLIRWPREERIWYPNEFIPILEKYNIPLMEKICRWALRRACEIGAQLPQRQWIAVNVSAATLPRPSFLSNVRDSLISAGLRSDRLIIEITETADLANIIDAKLIFTGLRSLRIGRAIDDFGMGYSCLARLSNIRPDYIKIDKHFIQGIASQDSEIRIASDAIVRGILALVRELGCSAIAEGIETQAQCDRLSELGCEFGQGYLFGYPRPIKNAP